MRLFVYCKGCGQKIYLNSYAKHRYELPSLFQLKCANLSCSHFGYYMPQDVVAEPNLTAASGAILGAALGLLLGPEGALTGGILGAAIGSKQEKEDLDEVNRFNSE